MDDREPRASLLHLPDARPGADFTARVLARVERWERRRAAGDGAADRGGWLLPGRRGTLVAAGLAAAVVAALGLWRPEGDWWTAGAPEATSPSGGEGLDERADARRSAGAGRAGGASASDGERIGERKRASRPAATEGGGAGAPDAGPGESAAAAGRRRDGRTGASSGAAGAGEGDASRSPNAEGSAASGAAASSSGGERGRAAALAHGPRVHRQPGATDRLAAGGPAETAAGALPTAAMPSTPFVDRGSPPPAAAAEPRLAAAADFFAAPPAAAPADPGAELLAARLARLAAERERLAARLAEFRRELPPAEPPVVLLGADEGLELVFDLGRFAAGREPEARPAVHSTTGPPRR